MLFAKINKIAKFFQKFVEKLIYPQITLPIMNFEELSLKLGLSREVAILIAVEVAILAVATLTGVPAGKISKVPF